MKGKCRSCGDEARDTAEEAAVAGGRSSADHCAECFLELTEGIIPGGTVPTFHVSGLGYQVPRQSHGRGKTSC